MKKPARKLKFSERLKYWLRHWKPIHLCWWFEKHGWKVPKYFIGATSNYNLTHFVFGTDSGTTDPDTQTFGTEDDPVTSKAKETPFFIRFQVRETGGKAGANSYWQLYYNTTNDPATADQVTTTGDGVVKIVDDPGSNIANFAATDTRVMSEWVGETFISGEYVDNADDTNSKHQLDSSDVLGYIEFQWCVQFESGAGDGTDYYFYPRCLDAEMDSHSVHPKITTAVSSTVNINQSDENPTITDISLQYITPYLIEQYDDNPTVTDEAFVEITPYLVNQYDEITVQDEATVAVIISINVGDDIAINRARIIGSIYNANLGDFGWIDFDPLRDVAYGTALTGDTFTSFDISDENNPFVLDQLTTTDNPAFNGCEGIAIEGYVAYVGAETSNSVISIDITDPENLAVLDVVTDATYLNAPECVRIYGKYLLVACYGSHSITPIDKSDPSNMVLKSSWMLQDATYLSTPVMINIKEDGSGGTVTNWSGTYFTSFDLSNGVDNMSVLHNVSHVNLTDCGGHDYAFNETVAVICSRTTNRVTTVDITDLSAMSYLGSLNHAELGGARVPKVIGDHALVTGTSADSVVCVDISTPSTPAYHSHIDDGTYLDGSDDIKYRRGRFWITCIDGMMLTCLDYPFITSVNIFLLPHEIEAIDNITIEDESNIELSLYKIYAYDELTIQDEEIVALAGEDIDISVFDLVYIHPAYRRLYVADNITVQDATDQYLDLYEIPVDDDITVEDYSDVSVTALDIDISVADENPTVTDESLQYITPYLVNVYDEITVQVDTQQYLSLHEIYVDDDLTIEDYGNVLLSGIIVISEYDSATVQDASDQYLTVYEIYAIDNVTVQDESSQYLTLYEIYQFDEITSLEDYANVSTSVLPIDIDRYDEVTVQEATDQYLTSYEISVYDDVTVQEETSSYLTLYEIYSFDTVTVEDSTDNALSLFLIDQGDQITVQDATEQYITPYFIEEYESITASDFSNQSMELATKDINVSESLTISEYANVAMIAYPFLIATLTIEANNSIIDIGQTMSELSVTR